MGSSRIARCSVALVGALLATLVPTVAAAEGVRLGPIETVCVEVPEATPGDVALTNVTVVDASAQGFVTAHNEDINPWAVSSVNFAAADTVPNLTATVVTGDRRVCLTSSRAASSHLVVDLVGLLDGDRFDAVPQGGQRILDTRLSSSPTTGSPVTAGSAVCTDVLRGGDGPAVALMNVTVTQPADAGFVTVHEPSNPDPLATSTHNFGPGQTVANLTMTPVDGFQGVCASASQWSDAHVIFDLVGWLDASVFRHPPSGSIRLFDTRQAGGPTAGSPVAPSATTCTALDGAATGGAAVGAGDLAIVNVAITQPDGAGFATVHGGQPGPVSTHNFRASQSIANLTAVNVGAAPDVCLTSSPWSSLHAVADLAGVIDADAVAPLPDGARRLIDSREEVVLQGRHGDTRLRFAECDELLATLQQRRLADLEYLGDDDDLPGVIDESDIGVAPPTADLPSTNGNDPVSTPEFSTTNTQDSQVDEGDLVETDGRYLYTSVVSGSFLETVALHVIDIAAGAVVAEVPLTGQYPEMILFDDQLVVTTSGESVALTPQTTVTVIDVGEPTAPVIVDRYGLDGARVAMRSADARVRTVLGSFRTPGVIRYDGEQTAGDVRDEVRRSTIDDWLPRVFDVDADGAYGGARVDVDCDEVGITGIDHGVGITWVAEEAEAHRTGPEAASGVVANGFDTAVMANRRHLYVAMQSFVPWSPTAFLDGAEVTSIHLFETDADTPIAYAASGEVPGRLLNQFAMGEHDGVLRVATTAGWWDESASAVFALRRTGPTFTRLAAVTDLAAGERIFAVRHIGAISYVVTFREVDPLFVIDFADPERPALRGELKIPGFSDYLHPVGPGLLLGVGQDAELDGTVTGAQLSLFDVSIPTDPRRIDTLTIDGWRRIFDHREFLFWAPTGTIALPAAEPDTGEQSIAVVQLDGRRLRDVGRFATAGFPCAPDRTVLVGEELLGVSRASTTIVDRATLAPRATIGDCTLLPPPFDVPPIDLPTL